MPPITTKRPFVKFYFPIKMNGKQTLNLFGLAGVFEQEITVMRLFEHLKPGISARSPLLVQTSILLQEKANIDGQFKQLRCFVIGLGVLKKYI